MSAWMIDGMISSLDKKGRVGILTSDDGHWRVRFAAVDPDPVKIFELDEGDRSTLTPYGLHDGQLSFLERGQLTFLAVEFEKEYV